MEDDLRICVIRVMCHAVHQLCRFLRGACRQSKACDDGDDSVHIYISIVFVYILANLVIIFVLTYVTLHLYYYLKNDKFAPQIASLVDDLIVYTVI